MWEQKKLMMLLSSSQRREKISLLQKGDFMNIFGRSRSQSVNGYEVGGNYPHPFSKLYYCRPGKKRKRKGLGAQSRRRQKEGPLLLQKPSLRPLTPRTNSYHCINTFLSSGVWTLTLMNLKSYLLVLDLVLMKIC